MIITKQLIRFVTEGRKTTHRMPVVDARPPTKPRKNGNRNLVHQHVPRVGEDYPVQWRPGMDPACYVHVLAVTRERLGTPEFHQVRAEGHRTTVGFADWWMCEHDADWPPVETCVACDGAGDQDCPDCFIRNPRTGELQGEHPPGCSACSACSGTGEQLADVDDQEVLDRFDELHATRMVWVVEFKLADVDAFLARPVPFRSGDYTRTPSRAIDTLPTVDADTLRPQWRENALKRHAGSRDRRDVARDLARRLAS